MLRLGSEQRRRHPQSLGILRLCVYVGGVRDDGDPLSLILIARSQSQPNISMFLKVFNNSHLILLESGLPVPALPALRLVALPKDASSTFNNLLLPPGLSKFSERSLGF